MLRLNRKLLIVTPIYLLEIMLFLELQQVSVLLDGTAARMPLSLKQNRSGRSIMLHQQVVVDSH